MITDALWGGNRPGGSDPGNGRERVTAQSLQDNITHVMMGRKKIGR